jgi:hypothetical protein
VTPSDDLAALRAALLQLHGAVAEHERVAYEGLYGRVSAGELLQLTISGSWFAWLRPLSELVVRIDEALAADDPPGGTEAGELAGAARAVVSPQDAPGALGRRYAAALQEAPDVVLAHGRVRAALEAWPAERDPG